MLSIRHNTGPAVEGYAVQLDGNEVRLRILGDGEALYARYNGRNFEIYPRFINEDNDQRSIAITSGEPLEAWAEGTRIGVFTELHLMDTPDIITLFSGAKIIAHCREERWTWVDGGELGPVTICNSGYMLETVALVPTVRDRVSSLAEPLAAV